MERRPGTRGSSSGYSLRQPWRDLHRPGTGLLGRVRPRLRLARSGPHPQRPHRSRKVSQYPNRGVLQRRSGAPTVARRAIARQAPMPVHEPPTAGLGRRCAPPARRAARSLTLIVNGSEEPAPVPHAHRPASAAPIGDQSAGSTERSSRPMASPESLGAPSQAERSMPG